jgi:pimeloyl-ACP methyl ester carboxylesterase
MRDLVARLAEESGGPVSLVGWSLGGVYARELARRLPDQVRQVITLASPFGMTDPAVQSRLDGAFKRSARSNAINRPRRPNNPEPLPLPSTAIYTRGDGVVDWHACLQPDGPRSESVRVYASHFGIGVDPATLWVIADRLAQPADDWAPFTATGPWRLAYPR